MAQYDIKIPIEASTREIFFDRNTKKLSFKNDNGIVEALGAPVWGGIGGTLANQADLVAALNGKQPTLVSGTSIKTINGNSVLGTGNISITSVAPRSRSIDNIGFNYFWGYGFGGDLGICDLRGVPGPIDFTVLINSGTNVTINLYRSYNPDSVSAGAVLVGSCSIGPSSAKTIKFTRTIITRQVSGEGYTNYFYRMLDTTSAVNDFQSLGTFPEGQYGYDNESGPQPGYPNYIVLNMPSPAVAFYKNLQYGT